MAARAGRMGLRTAYTPGLIKSSERGPEFDGSGRVSGNKRCVYGRPITNVNGEEWGRAAGNVSLSDRSHAVRTLWRSVPDTDGGRSSLTPWPPPRRAGVASPRRSPCNIYSIDTRLRLSPGCSTVPNWHTTYIPSTLCATRRRIHFLLLSVT